MATESEQVRSLKENELLKAENKRMVAELAEATDNFATYYRVAQERQDDVEQAQAQAQKLEAALRAITTPEGAYSRDPAEYRKNVIDWCIQTAEAALAEGGEDA